MPRPRNRSEYEEQAIALAKDKVVEHAVLWHEASACYLKSPSEAREKFLREAHRRMRNSIGYLRELIAERRARQAG